MRVILIWHWIGDARNQHGGWRFACFSPTCHTIFPILHLFCISSFPNSVLDGMQHCASIFSLYALVRINWSCMGVEEQVDKCLIPDEIIPATPANSRYAAMS